jgi:diguanylate cyclase (GGDEF)-like protein/PAS domain S-box-containing protein
MPRPFALFRHWLVSLTAVRPSVGGLFALALIPGILIGAVIFYGAYENQRSQLEAGALQTARALLRAIDSELNKTQATALTLAKSEYLASGDFAAFHLRAQEVIQATGAGHNCVLSDITGQQILNTAKPYPGALPRHGNIDQMNSVLRSGRPAISDIYIGAVLRRPLFSIDVPVVINGKISYVLSIGMLPERFSQLLMDQKLPPGWIAALLDSNGTVAARSQNPEQTIGKKGTPDLLAQMRLAAEGTMASHTLEGRPSFITYSQSATTRWTIVVGMMRDVLYESLYRPMALVGLAILAFLFGGILLAWIFSRYVRQELAALGATTEAVTHGDWNAKAPSSGLQEIANLADQFNRMQAARKQAEQALAESEKRFSLFMDTLPAAAFIKDENGRVLYANRYMADVLGAGAWRGKTTRELFPSEQAEKMIADDRRALEAGHVVTDEQVPGTDGQARLYQTHKFRIPQEGQPPLLGGIAVDITERKQMEEQIWNLAFLDPLTNLPNRRMLFDRLAHALSQAKRFERSLAIMFLDLDNFKKINDTLGHDVGDELLKEVAVRLNACVRIGDTVSRTGGDEFIIVLAEISRPDDAALVADKIIEAINVPMRIADNSLNVSTSIGIAVYPISGNDDAQELMKKADKALYAAKEAGRNGYRFFAD